jgi:ATP-dependent DNA ligase
MLAKAVQDLPIDDGWLFEPKWDGFRCLIFRDGDNVALGSRSDKELTRYFPELVEAVGADLRPGCVLDGEIVVPRDDRLDWEALSARVHPAASRVALLSEQTPATFVAFDLLGLDHTSLLDSPLRERKQALHDEMTRWRSGRLSVSVDTTDHATAAQWFEDFEGAGLDGVVAKALDSPYTPDKRTMLKLKHRRTADAVLIGYRLHKNSTPEDPLVGSLLLALHDDSGELLMVGGASAFTMDRRRELVDELAPLVTGTGAGETNRWTSGKDTSFVTLRPDRVCEVGYDQLQGMRFRHTVSFLRWRPDREPASCRFDQLEVPVRYSLDQVMRRA